MSVKRFISELNINISRFRLGNSGRHVALYNDYLIEMENRIVKLEMKTGNNSTCSRVEQILRKVNSSLSFLASELLVFYLVNDMTISDEVVEKEHNSK